MPTDRADGFADNWAYLRTELHWLERLLITAVARQRKENKEIDRLAQSRADRATSHWWKGVISLEGSVAHYDEHRQPAQPGSATAKGQQLETQIQASQKRGIVLALPALRDRLKLTAFEKNLVLMSLAPEVNRRYARLYRYLQGEDTVVKTDLPTLDLVLRLLCHNDVEWRIARNHLTASPLIQHHLLQLIPCAEDTCLNRPLKLAESLVHYLLGEQPTLQELESLLCSCSDRPSALLPARPMLAQTSVAVDWSDLVLPSSLLESLRALEQRLLGYRQTQEKWESHFQPAELGTIALLVGPAGTGKTMAAAAIAHSMSTPLFQVDLALVNPTDYDQLLQEIATQAPIVLLVKSAHLWLKRSTALSAATLNQFFAQRQTGGITLLSIHQQASVQIRWQRQMQQILSFPKPGPSDRLHLWKQAFPPQAPLENDIDWELLARQLPLTGGEIRAIAYEAVLYAATAPKISMRHVIQALIQRRQPLKIKLDP
jgi:hypothetical protein